MAPRLRRNWNRPPELPGVARIGRVGRSGREASTAARGARVRETSTDDPTVREPVADGSDPRARRTPAPAGTLARGVEHPRVALRRPGRALPIARQEPPCDLAVPAPGKRHDSLRVTLEQRVRESRDALGAGEVRGADEPRETPVTRLVAGEQHEMRAPLAVPHPAQVLAHGLAVAGKTGPLRPGMDRSPRLGSSGDGSRFHGTVIDTRLVRVPRLPLRPGRHRLPRPASCRHHQPMRIGDRRVEQLDLHADDGMDPDRLGRRDEPDRAVQALVIRDPERLDAELRRTFDEVVGGRRSVEERELGVAVELGVPRQCWPRNGTPV